MKNFILVSGISLEGQKALNRMLKSNGINCPPAKKTYYESIDDYAFSMLTEMSKRCRRSFFSGSVKYEKSQISNLRNEYRMNRVRNACQRFIRLGDCIFGTYKFIRKNY